ncbi:MAG: type 4a pilus biogenesis protein PilO [Acidobacteriota bacterium]|nr:type 4a pilus biogenesis protein PilO [Acidobacteriota bacterium]
MKLTKIQQLLAGFGIIVLALVMAQFVILKGDRQQIKSLGVSNADLNQKINVARAIEQTAAVLQEEMANLKDQLDRLKMVLPMNVDEPRFLSDIKRMANENGIEILALNKNDPRRDDVIVEIPFFFETRGNYHDYGRFFAQLTNYQRIVNIKSILIQEEKDFPGYSIDGRFIISVYTYKEPTQAELRAQINEKRKAKKKRK